jgi:hypothetical protein
VETREVKRRTRSFFLAVMTAVALFGATPAAAQEAPRLASLTASKLLLFPAQEMTGAPESAAWLTRFDSLLTVRLRDGGIGAGWAYPADAIRYYRQNSTYLTDPFAIGAQPLKSEKAKAGVQLPDVLHTRLRMFVALADARNTMIPIIAHIDTVASPRSARMQLTIVDARINSIAWTGIVEAKFDGVPAHAADSLANAVARLFVSKQ